MKPKSFADDFPIGPKQFNFLPFLQKELIFDIPENLKLISSLGYEDIWGSCKATYITATSRAARDKTHLLPFISTILVTTNGNEIFSATCPQTGFQLILFCRGSYRGELPFEKLVIPEAKTPAEFMKLFLQLERIIYSFTGDRTQIVWCDPAYTCYNTKAGRNGDYIQVTSNFTHITPKPKGFKAPNPSHLPILQQIYETPMSLEWNRHFKRKEGALFSEQTPEALAKKEAELKAK